MTSKKSTDSKYLGKRHHLYEFRLKTDAKIFYNQCSNEYYNPIYCKPKLYGGIIDIKENVVTCPDWMPFSPMSHSLIKEEIKFIE